MKVAMGPKTKATTLKTRAEALPLFTIRPASPHSPAMAEISAKLVKALRDQTGAGMMDCKRALTESGGDLNKATEWLRQKGIASAEKKAGRTAAEGSVGSYIHTGARVGVSSHGNAAGAPAGVDLVVLADSLASDPRLLRDLHAARVPHLPVRVRDGAGMVGPLVIPGVTSCLGCAD